ncbi:MAG: sugar phosphate nucleotidyltransferase, partial [Burkholderiaceae bacterium]
MIPVILCGGVGARLWPASRDGHPKPFMRLPGGGTLLQETLRRAARIPGARQALAVAHEELYFLLKDDFLAAGVPALEPCCLLEPVRRGTGPAVAAAALHGASTWGEDTPLLVLPADHLVEDDGEWLRAVQEARALAVQGKMVVFGIEPHRPETGYGYIEA